MTILPITYLGGIEWFSRLARGGCVIDLGENWVKQSVRNRAEILTAGGVAALTVPVHGYGGKIATEQVRIDNSKRWQHTHWASIVSAYRNSPYFDHYEERFAPVYARKFDFLVDLNLELLGIVTAALGLDGVVKLSGDYVAAESGDIDLRGKKAFRRAESVPADMALQGTVPSNPPSGSVCFQEYIQVFADRGPFITGLSIVDLLFCEGPSARELLLPRDRL